ncbi:VWA domain-containing protein [Rubellicoccus peritrichatus]|uniref:VWA domain-containing protein n=1 Tax=Rubellicoccus peritrichatus TaxID=3080537 RepID=A0AAQ3LD72_9BACT|nr:VWA domain-containing protein [Puniceicoccus sp. CR14]WOO42294.1 VWA domain-containing protein [Puniceicoccus sp. CR14]
MDFAFRNPELLWLLLALPVLAILKGRSGKSAALVFSSVAIARQVAGQARSSAGRFLFLLRLLALAALIIAMARPQIGEGHSEVEASGIDIVMAVDVSGSMRALDLMRPDEIATRLDIVKETIADFIEKRKNDRIGLVAFAKEPYLVSPLTLNHDWLLRNLERLHIGLIDESGTAIGAALGMSSNRLRDLPAKSRIVILLTDGEETIGQIPPVAAAEAAKAFDVKVYTIAAGKTGRVPMPRLDDQGNVITNRAGQVIVDGYMPSNIDEKTLKEIASITDGQFFRATDAKELEKIYEEIDKLEKTEVKLKHYANYTELFIWPALLGLCLIGVEQLLGNSIYRRVP